MWMRNDTTFQDSYLSLDLEIRIKEEDYNLNLFFYSNISLHTQIQKHSTKNKEKSMKNVEQEIWQNAAPLLSQFCSFQ